MVSDCVQRGIMVVIVAHHNLQLLRLVRKDDGDREDGI